MGKKSKNLRLKVENFKVEFLSVLRISICSVDRGKEPLDIVGGKGRIQ